MAIIAIDKLTRDEKLQLIEDLVDSLDHDASGLPPQHREELERRLATLEVDTARSARWEDFDRTLRQRYG